MDIDEIELDERLLLWVVRYHLIMMMFISLKDQGLKNQADRLLEITKELRYEIADKVVHAVVDELQEDDQYRLLFKKEENNLYATLLDDICRGMPLQ